MTPARLDRRSASREGQIQSIAWPGPLPSRAFRSQNRVLFALALALYVLAGLYLRRLDVYMDDAVARTAQAFSVLYSRDPHLGAIGCVWNPLPALLQLPLITVLGTLHLDPLLAGNLSTALCGAATLCVLNRAMLRAAFSSRHRLLLLVLYGLNPLIVLYSANGESEALFILLVVIAVTDYIEWAETRAMRALLSMTVFSALAVQTRYESLAVVAGIEAAIVLSCLPLWRHIGASGAARRIESYSIAYLVAPMYSFATWILFNWIKAGDPLYFLRSTYSNVADTSQFRSGSTSYLSGAVGSWTGSLHFGARVMLCSYPAFSGILLLATIVVLATGARSMTLLGTALISLVIPLFEIAMIERGDSYGWLRFFIYGIPFSMLLLIALGRALPRALQGRHVLLFWALIGLVLLGSDVASWTAMDAPSIGREEKYVACKILHPSWVSSRNSIRDPKAIDDAVQALPAGLVLLDTYQGFAIPVVSAHPDRYVVASDLDFETVLRHPAGRVRYILVPFPDANGYSDRVNQLYPSLWEHGSAWTRLVRVFPLTADNWKLFQVIGQPPVEVDHGTAMRTGPLTARNSVPEQCANG